jgi:release factor glutamine methyltransferase
MSVDRLASAPPSSDGDAPAPAPLVALDGRRPHVSVFRSPGVYPTQRDTWLLADVLHRELLDDPEPVHRVLELCSGAGALALVAAGVPGSEVTAVDVSRRALLCTWVNALVARRRVRVRRGDLTAPVTGRQFDLVVANPPYVPAPDDDLPTHGVARAFDGGRDGRTVLDRVCDEAPAVLAPGGRLLIVHSAVNGVTETLRRLRDQGLEAEVAARCAQPFGPVFRARSALLEQRGLIAAGRRIEELVVVRARK